MRVLDLFSGLRGWSDPWKAAGHEVFTVDFDPKFAPDLVANIMQWDLVVRSLPWQPDVILASPPCEAFSVMRIGTNWTKDHQPKTAQALNAFHLVEATMMIYRATRPPYFIMENPRAKLRRIVEIFWPELERRSVSYCRYGEDRMKPTDLWSPHWPATLELQPMCENGNPDHTRAPRGSRTGTQGGLSGELSAKIPRALSIQIMEAIEEDAHARA